MLMQFLLVCLVVGEKCLEAAATANCNEAVCASVVSKCMLTQSCKCDLSHRSCCKDCRSCLSYLFEDCCSCLDMCPASESLSNSLSREPYTELFRDGGVPALFYLFMAEPDPHKRWLSQTLSTDTDTDLTLQNVDYDTSKQTPPGTNCTVAYMSQCMSLNKCKANCESFGSSGFRWFRNECCECFGENCEHHISDEKRCQHCGTNTEIEEDIPEDNRNYGEDMEPPEMDS